MSTVYPEGSKSRVNIWRTSIFTIAHMFNDTSPNLYPVLLPVLMVQLNFGTAAAGLISTVSALTAQLLQPVMGMWADRIGGKYFVVGGLAIGSILAGVSLGLAPTYNLLLLGLLVAGLGNASFHPHASALVSDVTGNRKGFGMSLFMIGGNFGRALAPIMASTAFLLGGRHGLILAALPGIIMSIVMFRVLTPAPEPKPHLGKIFTPEFIKGLRKASSLLVVVGLRSMATLTTLTLLPILWKLWGHPMAETAGLLSLMFIAGSLGNVAGGYLSDIFGPKPVLVASAILSSLWLILFLSTSNPVLSFLLIALLGASLYSTGSVVMVFSQALFPANKGMASGLTLGIGNTLGSLGVAVLGFISDRYSPAIGLWLTAGALLLSVPFVLGLKFNNPD
ncbi:MAG: MFS transporter [Peptococcaceae bacterium]|nr:MFS transporter [Peptococcaceae bacterium]